MKALPEHHRQLSALLASHNDSQLTDLLHAGEPIGVGVGGESALLHVDGTPIFAKRIPLSDLELTHRGSTANLFDLPTFCQYGIGGPSFNAWRELAANILVTNAVLASRTTAFPLLYHWRILPGRPPIAAEHEDIDAIVTLQGNSPAVRTRLEALAAASSSLLLLSEYIPLPVEDWLRDNPTSKAPQLAQQLSTLTEFLTDTALLHMDGHFGNLRSDGHRLYLTDFGLATSPNFTLSPAEQDFVTRNATHDADYAAMRLVNWLVTDICGVVTPPGTPPIARNEYVIQCAAGHIPSEVPQPITALLTRYAPAAARMNAFYWKLFGGDIHAEYPAAHADT